MFCNVFTRTNTIIDYIPRLPPVNINNPDPTKTVYVTDIT